MRVHVVANPTAGRGRVPGLLDDLSGALAAAGVTSTLHRTTGPGDARAHLSGVDPAAFDRLVVVGGDGTLHEAVNARAAPLPWPVAIVPVGTANLVARDAGMPLHERGERLARIVLEGIPWTVDLLETDRGLSLANVGVGIDAEVVNAVARARSGGLGGYAKWLRPIAETFVRYAPPLLEVSVDGGAPIEGGAVVVQNTFCYGGLFTLAPRARMDDGRLEVTVLRRAGRRDYFRMLTKAYGGRLLGDRGVTIVEGTSVTVTGRAAAAVQTDGDPAGTTPITVRMRPKALTLLRPAPPR